MAIFVTGDIHGSPERFSSFRFECGRRLTKEDYIIILGDFGLIWNKDGESAYEEYWLNWLDSKPWTTLFVDGNHENYDRLHNFEEYPCEEWHGGLVQKIRPSVIHLCRGEIFDIGGYSFLAMGGAASHDIQDGVLEIGDPRIKEWEKDRFKLFRVNHESWWEQEIPNEKERDNAICNLSLVNNKVDFVLSHEAPASDVFFISNGWFLPDGYSQWLEQLRQTIDYKKWFFGHYHENKAVNDREICFFEKIQEIA